MTGLDEQLLLDAPAERPCTHQRVYHPHGTLGRHKSDGCRCLPCRTAGTAYERNRARQIAYGTWSAFADVGPVRTHLQRLIVIGLWKSTIAQRSGVSVFTVGKILSVNPPRRIRTNTAEALLSVEPGFQRSTAPLFD